MSIFWMKLKNDHCRKEKQGQSQNPHASLRIIWYNLKHENLEIKHMKKYKIFVSGVQKELKQERRVIKDSVLNDALLSEYFNLFLFEDAPAKSKSAETSYLGEVKKSDIYIGILGTKYGSTASSKICQRKRTDK